MAKDKNKNKNQKTQIQKVKARSAKAVEASKAGDAVAAVGYLAKAQKAAEKAKKKKLAKKIVNRAKNKSNVIFQEMFDAAESAPSPTPPSAPSQPAPQYSSVKQVEQSVILFDEDAIPVEVMSDLIFEDIGGLELINTARHDAIDGQNIEYTPIKLLSIFNRQFDPNDLIAGQRTDSSFFDQYSLKIGDLLPPGSALEIDPTTGNLIITLEDLPEDQLVQIEILSDGTIYKIGE